MINFKNVINPNVTTFSDCLRNFSKVKKSNYGLELDNNVLEEFKRFFSGL